MLNLGKKKGGIFKTILDHFLERLRKHFEQPNLIQSN